MGLWLCKEDGAYGIESPPLSSPEGWMWGMYPGVGGKSCSTLPVPSVGKSCFADFANGQVWRKYRSTSSTSSEVPTWQVTLGKGRRKLFLPTRKTESEFGWQIIDISSCVHQRALLVKVFSYKVMEYWVASCDMQWFHFLIIWFHMVLLLFVRFCIVYQT